MVVDISSTPTVVTVLALHLDTGYCSGFMDDIVDVLTQSGDAQNPFATLHL